VVRPASQSKSGQKSAVDRTVRVVLLGLRAEGWCRSPVARWRTPGTVSLGPVVWRHRRGTWLLVLTELNHLSLRVTDCMTTEPPAHVASATSASTATWAWLRVGTWTWCGVHVTLSWLLVLRTIDKTAAVSLETSATVAVKPLTSCGGTTTSSSRPSATTH